jgi:hypothetical protein
MKNEISKVEKIRSIASHCKNVDLMDSMVERYQKSTKSAVENILNMCVAVSEISGKHKAKEINDFDMMYFCSQVGLEQKSSTFRKYRQIGDHANRFVQHMNTLPSAYTVLFQITTLDPDKFEEMISSGKITPSLSLEELKKLTNSTAHVNNDDIVNFKVEFDMNKLSSEGRDFLKKTLLELMNFNEIQTIIPAKYQPAFNNNKYLKNI